jgi:hypothetical protein
VSVGGSGGLGIFKNRFISKIEKRNHNRKCISYQYQFIK